MLGRWFSICAVTLAGVVPGTLAVSVALPTDAHAAPGANYPVGTRLKAKRDCTLKGFAIKKGVVLTVSAVHDDGKALDLEFSGMTISGVQHGQVASLFNRV
jgi:hypothetical protein